tara:strand:+ start:497 stop:628 length:132 start_codon:yes stop_codon:yes gene_type:complete
MLLTETPVTPEKPLPSSRTEELGIPVAGTIPVIRGVGMKLTKE